MVRRSAEDIELSQRVDRVAHKLDATFARFEGRTPAGQARRRHYGRSARSLGKRMATMGGALAALIVATIVFSQIVGPIGLFGLFLVALLTLAILVFFSFAPTQLKRVEYSDELPTARVVQQLESLLVRERRALPAPAAHRVDAISAALPQLEHRLAEVDLLDPLAQDARRLMGKHLPELIERYERVPAAYRAERDGEGMTADERLVASLDAARNALDEIGSRLVQSDRQAFETQGRFIESRYKDPGGVSGQ
ncbi:MAG TPA: hypothetical protein VEZ70_05260 [Allosphingosinicella sp.]|nr:hypothetical protein [Allosphingosinicella sp.]